MYKIYKSAFVDMTYTKHLGAVYLGLSYKHLRDEYERLRAAHQDALYERLRKQQEVLELKQQKKVEKALQPQVPKEELLRISKAILPQIVDANKDSDQGLINVQRMRKVLEEASGIILAHNASYNLRKELLEYVHENNDEVLKKLRRQNG